MRIVKEYDERRNELLDTAERLFYTKGFQHTTIDDVRKEINVAKGTFYHYFKSKDEILDAVVERIVEKDYAAANEIAQNSDLSPLEKFSQILMSQRSAPGEVKRNITESAHIPENAQMHLKTIVKSIKRLSPVLADVVTQGVKNGDFQTNYPREVMDLLLISGQMLFDEAIFDWTPKEAADRLKAYISSVELLLGAKKNSFDFLNQIINQN